MKDKRTAFLRTLITTEQREIKAKQREKNIKTRKIVVCLREMIFIDFFAVNTKLDNDLTSWLKKYFDFHNDIPNDIKQIIHERLMKCGEDSYHQLTYRVLPEDMISPYALAYFLSHDGISKEKAKLIKFDHGDTLESFMELADGLFANIVRQLTTQESVEKKVKAKYTSDVYDPHPVCTSCC